MMTRVEMNQSFRRALVSEMNGCGERTPLLKPSVAALYFAASAGARSRASENPVVLVVCTQSRTSGRLH